MRSAHLWPFTLNIRPIGLASRTSADPGTHEAPPPIWSCSITPAASDSSLCWPRLHPLPPPLALPLESHSHLAPGLAHRRTHSAGNRKKLRSLEVLTSCLSQLGLTFKAKRSLTHLVIYRRCPLFCFVFQTYLVWKHDCACGSSHRCFQSFQDCRSTMKSPDWRMRCSVAQR